MGMRTLYIGETNRKDTKYYYELDKSARNLYIGNHETALEEKPTGVFYTSLPDFGKRFDILFQVCLHFDEIIYRPPAVWTKDYVEQQTKELLKYIMFVKSDKSTIKGYSKLVDIDLRTIAEDQFERTKEPHMWVSGCSWSSAWGVSDNERWATLLASKLNIPYTVLAEPGSGNSYQAKKLLSADIRENDVVIFQVTSPPRETIIDPKYGQIHVNAHAFTVLSDLYKRYSPDRLVEMTLLLNQIRDIQNIANFLQKTKARFMFWAPGNCLPMEIALESFVLGKDYFYLYPGGSMLTLVLMEYTQDLRHTKNMQTLYLKNSNNRRNKHESRIYLQYV